MLSSVLNSDRAITMNIAIMRAFVEIRKILIEENDLRNQIYDAMENLLDKKAAERKWDGRSRIGFNLTTEK